MPSWLLVLLGVAIITCTVLIVDAVVGLWRASTGANEDPVHRRLAQVDRAEEEYVVVNPERAPGVENLFSAVATWLTRLVTQSGSTVSMGSLLAVFGALSVIAIAVLMVMLPASSHLLAVPLGIASAVGSIILYFMQRRAARVAKFEEQLPDTIDLIVRSLRVGHPFSGCLGVVATELPAPIGEEFRIAHYKVSYGFTVSGSFREMAERVPLPDLKYLIAVLQMHEETGGNLVESLNKLAVVIRERFRMFRKVKALTAEGRMSAWLLSAFPFATGAAVRFIKPDYYDAVMKMDDFPIVVIVLVVLLVANIVVMNSITKIKV